MAVRLDGVEIAHRRQNGLVRPRIGQSRIRAVRGGHGRVGHLCLSVVIYRPMKRYISRETTLFKAFF